MVSQLERVARAICAADGLNWDEPCGFESDQDECDSGTCVAALCEDHDPDWSRTMYLQHARAAIAAMQGELDAVIARDALISEMISKAQITATMTNDVWWQRFYDEAVSARDALPPAPTGEEG